MSDVVLWLWIFASPLVWFLNLAASYAVASHVCASGGKTVLYSVSAFSLLTTAVAAGVCGSQWRLIEPSRKRAMAFGGSALGSLCFLVILAQAIPNIVMAGCE
jgi:hypothetical protein